MIDKKHAVQNIALTETMTLSLFSLIISYLLALSSHFLTFCRQQCGGNQKSSSYQGEVHDKQLSRFMSRLFFGLSQDAPLCHKMSCVSSIIWTAVSLCPQQRSRQMFDFLLSVHKCDDK